MNSNQHMTERQKDKSQRGKKQTKFQALFTIMIYVMM